MINRRLFLFLPLWILPILRSYSKPFAASLKCRSIIYPHREFNSSDDFWKVHEDAPKMQMYKNIDSWYLSNIKKVSILMDDKKTIQIYFIFKNKLIAKQYTNNYRIYYGKVTKRLNIEYFDKKFSDGYKTIGLTLESTVV